MREHFEGECREGHHGHSHVVLGLVVVVFGGLLLLRQVGVLPATMGAGDLWPLLLVGLGLGRIGWRRGVAGNLFGVLLAAAGVALLLENLGLVTVGLTEYWPVLIVAGGVALMFKGPHRGFHGVHAARETASADFVQRSVTLGGAQIRVDSRQFRGGELSSVMGGIELDLRQADIAGDEAVLDFHVVMGGVEVRVPETWRVVNEVAPTMGAVEDRAVRPSPAEGAGKRLVLRGKVVMGEVSVKN
jgi:predicted membrane protein